MAEPMSQSLSDRCPRCQEPLAFFYGGIRDFFVSNGKSPEFSVHKCAGCELAVASPALSEAELGNYYPTQYEPYQGKRGFRGWLQTIKYGQDTAALEAVAGKTQLCVFEVGCGSGEFLAALAKRGHTVAGLEPGSGREHAQRALGLQVSDRFASDYVFEKRYDAVVSRYVIEHLSDPFRVLENIRQSGLKPGGVLLIKLPAMGCWLQRVFGSTWDGWDAPRHRILFTPTGIRKALVSLGYEDVAVRLEAVGVDLLRTLEFTAKYGQNGWARAGWGILARLPYSVRLVTAQGISWLLSPWGSSRMTITARSKGTR